MIGDRVQILRNISLHVNKGYDNIYSRMKYIVIANVNDNIYVLNDNCIYRFYELKSQINI